MLAHPDLGGLGEGQARGPAPTMLQPNIASRKVVVAMRSRPVFLFLLSMCFLAVLVSSLSTRMSWGGAPSAFAGQALAAKAPSDGTESLPAEAGCETLVTGMERPCG